jgi:tetratricopeptide (TPR) repeat protein
MKYLKQIMMINLCVLAFLCGPSFSEEKFADLKATGDINWKERDNITKLKICLQAYEKAIKIKPNDQEILERLSIGYYWFGNLQPGKKNKQIRMDVYQKGMDYAKKLTDINPRSAAGIFWNATNNASYCKERGFTKSALNIGSIKEQAKQVIEIERYYYRGGPQRLLARIYWGTPWLLRKSGESLEDGANLIKDVLSKYPNFTLSYIFLGDIYWEMSEKKLSRQTFEKVFTIPENALPEFMPENRRDRQTAKEKLKEYFGL